MNSEQATRVYLLYLGLHHHLGMKFNAIWRGFKKDYRRNHGYPKNCVKCGVKCIVSKDHRNTENTLTLDHIIPKAVIFELQLVELMFDEDNFAVYCHKCNRRKSGEMPDLDEIPEKLLGKFYLAVDNRNKRLQQEAVYAKM